MIINVTERTLFLNPGKSKSVCFCKSFSSSPEMSPSSSDPSKSESSSESDELSESSFVELTEIVKK